MSHWASFVAIVHEVTGLDPQFILERLPLAQGHQYVTLGMEKSGVKMYRRGSQSGGVAEQYRAALGVVS